MRIKDVEGQSAPRYFLLCMALFWISTSGAGSTMNMGLPSYAKLLAETTSLFPSAALYSPDGTRVAYVEAHRDGRESVSINGKMGKSYQHVRDLQFLRNGDLAYIANQDNQFTVVYNTTELAHADRATLLIAPDLTQFGYWTYRHNPQATQMTYAGKTHPQFERINSQIVSPDGAHVAYIGIRERKRYLVRDGEIVEDFGDENFVRDGRVVDAERRQPVFTLDGRLSAQVADDPDTVARSADGQHRADVHHLYPADAPKIVGPSLGREGTPKSPPLALELNVDGKVIARHAWISQVSFTASNRLAYVVRLVPERRPSLLGRAKGIMGGADSKEKFFDDARYLSEAEQNGVRHNLIVPGHTPGSYRWILDYRVSVDEKHVALVASDEPWRHARGPILQFVVVDGARHHDYEQIRCLVFSPSGRHVLYVAQRASGQFVVVDGVAGNPYSNIACPRFSADEKVIEYGARQDKRFLWLREPITALAPLTMSSFAGTYIGKLSGYTSSESSTESERQMAREETLAKQLYPVLRFDAKGNFRYELKDREQREAVVRIDGKYAIDGLEVRLTPHEAVEIVEGKSRSAPGLVTEHLGGHLNWYADIGHLMHVYTRGQLQLQWLYLKNSNRSGNQGENQEKSRGQTR